ncbi:MAG: hydrogenase maturation peptidase HycI [Candidatus Methanomethylicia archaeon]|nr:hydrogenase maturation peptidase HycI [Candidatus Methanomethylicia archaeon]
MGNINKISDIECFKNLLYNFIADARKVVIMGVGNLLRGDDAIGIKIIEDLKEKFHSLLLLNKSVILLNCGFSPENFLGKLETISPSHIIIIDAVEMGSTPGSIGVFRKEDLIGFVTISTHNISPELLFTFLEDVIGAKVLLLGIQPKNLNFCEEISNEVCEAASIVIDVLLDVIKNVKNS